MPDGELSLNLKQRQPPAQPQALGATWKAVPEPRCDTMVLLAQDLITGLELDATQPGRHLAAFMVAAVPVLTSLANSSGTWSWVPSTASAELSSNPLDALGLLWTWCG